LQIALAKEATVERPKPRKQPKDEDTQDEGE